MRRAPPLLAGLLLAGGCGGCDDARSGRAAQDARAGPESAADVAAGGANDAEGPVVPRDGGERTNDVSPAGAQDTGAAGAAGPPIPETPPEFQERLEREMGPCEQYVQPAQEPRPPGAPSGLDAYHLGGVDAKRVVFSSGHMGDLWSFSLASRQWRWIGAIWARVAYSGGMVLAVGKPGWQPDQDVPLRVRLWHLDEGWQRDLEPQYGENVDHPAIGDGFIAYSDYRRIPNWGTSRFPSLYDLETGESTVLSELGREVGLDAAGTLVVWVDARHLPERPTEIYLHEHAQGRTRPLTEDDFFQFNPRTDGRSVVWEDARNGTYTPPNTSENCDVYLFHAPDGTYHQVTTERHNQERPDVDGDFVVYQDDRAGAPPQSEELTTRLNLDVYLTNWRTGREFQMTYNHHQQYEPRLTGRKLAVCPT